MMADSSLDTDLDLFCIIVYSLADHSYLLDNYPNALLRE